MSFFVAPPEDALDLVTEKMTANPYFAERYDAIHELKEMDRQGLTISVDEAAKANGFYRVASLQGTLSDLAHILDPNWMKEKRRFYQWLNKHPQHCTYDRRKNAVSKQVVMVDGKVVT